MTALLALLAVFTFLPATHAVATVRREPQELAKVSIDKTGQVMSTSKESNATSPESNATSPESTATSPESTASSTQSSASEEAAKRAAYREKAAGDHDHANAQGVYAMDGCSTVQSQGCAHMETSLQDPHTVAGVVCCDATGHGVKLHEPTECFGDSVYGQRNGDSVNAGKTFADAKKFCERKGLRMCTFNEVYSLRACSVGCGMDCTRIWAPGAEYAGGCSVTTDSFEQGGRCKGNATLIDTEEDCCSDQGIASGYQWVKSVDLPAASP